MRRAKERALDGTRRAEGSLATGCRQPVNLRVAGEVGIITLLRPPINALDGDSIEDLAAAFRQWRDDEAVSAVVITGGVRNAFCTGGDLRQLFGAPMTRIGSNRRERLFASFQRCFRLIESYPKLTVAAINGVAIGAGVELALVCDLRVASELAFFSLPELKHGFIPGLGATQRLRRLIGLGRAKELMLTGKWLRAERALCWGLVNSLAPHQRVVETAVAIAREVAARDLAAVSALKQCILAGFAEGQERCLELETGLFSRLIDRLLARGTGGGSDGGA